MVLVRGAARDGVASTVDDIPWSVVGADEENLMHSRRIANKLFGDDYRWSVLAAGRHQLSFVTMAAMLGGNVRVGLEDSLYIAKGKLAEATRTKSPKFAV